MIEINIPHLIAEHSWVAEGFRTLEDSYREYQRAYGTSQNSRDTSLSHRVWIGVTELLVRQIANLLDMNEGDVQVNVKGYLYECCGMHDNPKGMDEWRFGNGRATVS